MKRSLITVGAGGRVGRLLQQVAARCPSDVRHFWTSRNADSSTESDRFRWTLDDGADKLGTLIARSGERATLFVLAGVTSGSETELAANAELARSCLVAAKRSGVARVLLASSSAVYGQPRFGPLTETDEPHLANAYGLAKLAMESIAAPFRDDGIDVCCLRIGNVLGADSLMRAAESASPDAPVLLDRFPDGDGPRRSYIGPKTLLRVVESLAGVDVALPFLLNTAAPNPVSMAALARAAEIPWKWREAPDTARQDITLSCARLETLFAFSRRDSEPDALIKQLELNLGKDEHDAR